MRCALRLYNLRGLRKRLENKEFEMKALFDRVTNRGRGSRRVALMPQVEIKLEDFVPVTGAIKSLVDKICREMDWTGVVMLPGEVSSVANGARVSFSGVSPVILDQFEPMRPKGKKAKAFSDEDRAPERLWLPKKALEIGGDRFAIDLMTWKVTSEGIFLLPKLDINGNSVTTITPIRVLLAPAKFEM